MASHTLSQRGYLCILDVSPSTMLLLLLSYLFYYLLFYLLYYIIIILDVSPSTHLFSAENKHKEAVANSWVFTLNSKAVGDTGF